MKIKTSALTGAALDWAAAKCEKLEIESIHPGYHVNVWKTCPLTGDREVAYAYEPSRDWSQGGSIIERMAGSVVKHWLESSESTRFECHLNNLEGKWVAFGPTELIARLRCFVASKLGDEVDVPDEIAKPAPARSAARRPRL